MSFRVSLRCILRMIRVDALRRVHNVGFLVGRFICFRSPKRVILVELDVPLDERVDVANALKKETYQNLTDTCRDGGRCGFPSQSVWSLLGVVDLKGRLCKSTFFGKLL